MTGRSTGGRAWVTGAVVAVVLLACAALPSLASASPVLKDSAGALPGGAQVLGTGIGNFRMTTSLGTLECQKTEAAVTVTKNNGTEIEGEITTVSITGTGTGGKCTTAFLGEMELVAKKLPWCLKAGGKLPKDGLTVTSGVCPGGGGLELVINSSIWGACTYTKAAIEGSFTTGTGAATRTTLTISEQEFKKTAGGSLCPASFRLDFSFQLETNSPAHEAIWIE